MILYGVPLSPFVRKTMFMLYELELAFEQRMILPAGTDSDFRATSPLGRIPGFEDGDFKIFDSSAICQYLVIKHASRLMGYDDAQNAARIAGCDKYADEDLAPPGLTLLFERIVKPMRMDQTPDEAAVEDVVTQKLPPVFDVLEARLAGREWFVGDAFSFADITIAAHMTDLPLAGVTLDAGRWPVLGAWFTRVQARPSVARGLAEAERFAAGE